MRETIEVRWEDDEGCEQSAAIPARYEVCGRCHGRGVHDHEAFANGISPEEFAEDPDFAEDYFKGVYDVQCSECHGKRVVLVPDEEDLNEEERKVLEIYYENLRARAVYRREEAYARRMGF